MNVTPVSMRNYINYINFNGALHLPDGLLEDCGLDEKFVDVWGKCLPELADVVIKRNTRNEDKYTKDYDCVVYYNNRYVTKDCYSFDTRYISNKEELQKTNKDALIDCLNRCLNFFNSFKQTLQIKK